MNLLFEMDDVIESRLLDTGMLQLFNGRRYFFAKKNVNKRKEILYVVWDSRVDLFVAGGCTGRWPRDGNGASASGGRGWQGEGSGWGNGVVG